MFNYSIDNKPTVTDPDGVELVDLTKSIFTRQSGVPMDYDIKRVTSEYVMRPDLVSFGEYGTDQHSEWILKFTGISNPFSFNEDDVLMIPKEDVALNMMKEAHEDDTESGTDSGTMEVMLRNYYKYVNQDYKTDRNAYDSVLNMKIPSGNIEPAVQAKSPYISSEGERAVTMRNGRIYFGEDLGLNAINQTSVDKQIRDTLNNAMIELSDSNCLYNGMSLSSFVRATNQIEE